MNTACPRRQVFDQQKKDVLTNFLQRANNEARRKQHQTRRGDEETQVTEDATENTDSLLLDEPTLVEFKPFKAEVPFFESPKKLHRPLVRQRSHERIKRNHDCQIDAWKTFVNLEDSDSESSCSDDDSEFDFNFDDDEPEEIGPFHSLPSVPVYELDDPDEVKPLKSLNQAPSLKSFLECSETDRADSSSSTLMDKLPEDLQLCDLKKKRILGEGMFGQVWMVHPPHSTHPYALKIQSKYELEEQHKAETVAAERQILKDLSHPFIVTMHATFQDAHFVYMLFDMIQGGELWSQLHPAGDTVTDAVALPQQEVKFYILALTDALQAIHKTNYVYRDLKPENVLIDRTGYPILIDFGLAKRLEGGEKTYTMAGTPANCAPEIIDGMGHDSKADMWSLGILAYEMLSGSNPFSYGGIQQHDLYRSIVQDDTPALPEEISHEGKCFVSSLLQKEASLRPSAAGLLQSNWFEELSLAAMRNRRVRAPWVPKIVGDLDASYYDDWSELEDKQHQDFPTVDSSVDNIFSAF